ncbi:3-oxoadipate CoA-transferase [Marinobacter fuscus]|uniref:3-oxoadipate CoA-transferase n=1 Tax=Marinobacter fuscus TaxID=2109942 RepID=A0A2T1KPI6_9GAMM|nr:CoA-transferase [Marinobacter fuscus]PSF11940.1 3-oxoadipate CoA-transferase [Marinobacter fuscus]
MNTEDRSMLAARIAGDIPEGAYVNLGIGMPTLVANHLGEGDKEVILHTENGVLGRWIDAPEGEQDPDLVNAGKVPIKLLPGAAIFHHADSFAMMRGGHLDICVLGAFQVACNGDLANWHTGDPDAIPAVGGAMDLAIGAKQTFVMMDHVDRDGRPKIVPQLTYPPTGLGCVTRIYTNYGTFETCSDGNKVRALFVNPAVSREEIVRSTAVEVDFSGI